MKPRTGILGSIQMTKVELVRKWLAQNFEGTKRQKNEKKIAYVTSSLKLLKQ